MQISWKQKLSSKKFWCTLIATVAAVGAAIGLSDGSVEKITSIIGAFATLITYILVEGNIDAKRVEKGAVKVETVLSQWPVEGTEEPLVDPETLEEIITNNEKL